MHSVASDLGLQCLPMSHKMALLWVNVVISSFFTNGVGLFCLLLFFVRVGGGGGRLQTPLTNILLAFR